MFWLQCQKGLFFRAMRLLRDQHLGGRLHVIVCVRDHVLAAVLRGEHQNRYRGEPHIISLEWDYEAAEYFLREKVQRLDPRSLLREPTAPATITDWLGFDVIENRGRGLREPIVQYLLRHTRLLPRDLVILGNRLCQEVQLAKRLGQALDPAVVRRVVREVATSFANEQLAICANHIASSGMPSDAVRLELDEIYTGDSEYSRGLREKLIEVLRTIGKDRFGQEELQLARLHAEDLFGEGSDAFSVLWQNRLLGFTVPSPDGPIESFFSEKSCDHFALPLDRTEYCLHSSLIDLVGLLPIGPPVGRAVPGRGSLPPPSEPLPSPELPERIGNYQVMRRLGKGAFGEVFLARDPRLGRQVALKVLVDALCRNPEWLARFRREAVMLANLNHPGIATIYATEQHNLRRFLVMEFVEGRTLQELLRNGAIPLGEALDLAHQIAHALAAAHQQGVVHRDLKPSNVMVRPDRLIKVLDFGLAKQLPSGATVRLVNDLTPTESGTLLGTPGYMSPEQIRGLQVDERTDIFSFGCLWFECLTGTPAFRGDTAMERLNATLHGDPELHLLPDHVPGSVVNLLERCLLSDPAARPSGFGEILDAVAAEG